MPEVSATGIQTCAGSRCLETAGVPPVSRGAVAITATQSRNAMNVAHYVGGAATGTAAQASITGE